jgi:hypothetical protein
MSFTATKSDVSCCVKLLTESKMGEIFNMKTFCSSPLNHQSLNGVKIIITTVSATDEAEQDSQWNDS